MGSLTQCLAEIQAPWEPLSEALRSMDSVADFDIQDLGEGFLRCKMHSKDGNDLRPMLFEMISKRAGACEELTQDQPSLEDLFVQLTHVGRVTREEPS